MARIFACRRISVSASYCMLNTNLSYLRMSFVRLSICTYKIVQKNCTSLPIAESTLARVTSA
jgi:hypothetical protein